ncbi:MAG: hypothetical protein MSA65_03700 [Mollicutes bacterium]|nr:hypothetical protein [Mollicutes bacterium]
MGKQKTASSRKQKQKQKQENIEKIKEQIKEQLIDVMSKDVCEKVQENFGKLVTAAETLYKNLHNIEDQKKLIAKVEEKAESLRAFFSTKKNLSLLINNRKESKQQKVINDVLKYVHEFELALDQFLNRKVQLVWVDEEGNLLVATEDGYNELLSTATVDSSNIRGKMAENAMRNLEKDNNNKYIDNKVLEEFEQSIKNRKEFYKLAIKRYEATTIEDTGKKKPQKHFYWKKGENEDPEPKNIRGEYVLSKKINNKGRIAEAYVESVINEYEEKNLEVNNWLRHLNNLIYEDNISAILRGDVIKKIINENTGDSKIKQNKNTEELEQHFAVKSGSWSTAGIRQYLLLAERLLKYKNTKISPALFRIGLPMLLNAKSSETVNNIVESTGEAVSNKAEEKINNTISDQLTNLLNIYFRNTSVEDMAKRTAILSANLNIKLEI